MRRFFLAAVAAAFLAPRSEAQPSTSAGQGKEEARRPWTLLVYAAVDNSADDPFVDFTDQVRRAIDDDPGVELVVLIDRSDRHRKRVTFLGDDFTGTRIYRVRKDAVERLSGGAHLPQITNDQDVNLNSADASLLKGFIAWGKANYPARRYGLLIYSHANGKTMCPDNRANSEMGIAEVTDKIGVEGRVDFLALELCNMGGAEIAYQWRPGNGRFEADVLLAIPNAGEPLDWDRAFRRIRSPAHVANEGPALDPAKMTAADFGKLVIEEGRLGRAASEKNRGRGSKESAGCYDLHKAGEVKEAVDALAAALAKANAKEAFVELRNSTSGGRLMRYSEDDSYVDLYELCRRVVGCERLPHAVRTAASGVMKSLEGFMIASFGMSGYKGFEAGKNGVFIVLPSGGPNCWKHYRWYTPKKGDRGEYGHWSFLKDGATPGDGVVDNWFELLESWFGAADDKGVSGPAPGAKEELAKLEGEWTMVSLEERGEKAPDERVKRFKLTIKGDQWTVTSSQGKGKPPALTMTVDPSSEPRTMDLTGRDGDREFVFLCIYKLEGDTLTLRRAMETGDVKRPQEFSTTPEEGLLVVWKHASK
jgi:clostripain